MDLFVSARQRRNEGGVELSFQRSRAQLNVIVWIFVPMRQADCIRY